MLSPFPSLRHGLMDALVRSSREVQNLHFELIRQSFAQKVSRILPRWRSSSLTLMWVSERDEGTAEGVPRRRARPAARGEREAQGGECAIEEGVLSGVGSEGGIVVPFAGFALIAASYERANLSLPD